MAAAATTPQPAPGGQPRSWVPSLPNLSSILTPMNPFAVADKTQDASADDSPTAAGDAAASSTKKRPNLSHDRSNPANPPSPSRSSGSIMFAEPDSQFTSPSASRDVSPDGRRRSRKSNSKSKTSFSICHPPPASAARQKLHRTPRSLLQLHKLTPNARPTPAFEVIPSASFSVRLTRAITKVFKAKHGLCPNDLVVLRAEKYYTEGREEEQEARDVLALICKGRKEESSTYGGKAKICTADGAEWEAYALPNGGYEFFSTDEHGLGLTVRWVPKRHASNGSKDVGRDSPAIDAREASKRFNFSTISPNSRRHPVIANLTKSSLAIHDSYKMPLDAAALTPQATPTQKSTPLQDTLHDELPQQDVRTTDAALRDLITVTAIWVAFKENWSPFFKYDDPPANASTIGSQPGANSSRKSVNSPVSTPPGSPAAAPSALDKRNSIRSVGSSLFRRASARRARSVNRGSTISLDYPEDAEPTSPGIGAGNVHRSTSVQVKGRSRGESNATVLVHRAASNRRRERGLSTGWRGDPALAGRPEGIEEGSREDVRAARITRNADPSDGEDGEETGGEEDGEGEAAGPEKEMLQRGSRRSSVAKSGATETGRGRESTATTDTGHSTDVPKQKGAVVNGAGKPAKDKKKGWRRLFCGKL